MTGVGPLVTGRLRPAWEIYFRYFMLRSSGLSRDQVQAGGDFLNYGISWEDAERVYLALSRDPSIGPAMRDRLTTLKRLQTEAIGIVDAIKAQGF